MKISTRTERIVDVKLQEERVAVESLGSTWVLASMFRSALSMCRALVLSGIFQVLFYRGFRELLQLSGSLGV